MKVILTDDNNREYDVTEHFQVMYDSLVGSMDWGSGFLSGDDALLIMEAGAAAGFKVYVGGTEAAIAPIELDPTQPKAYTRLAEAREQWVKDVLGDPPTWERIVAYRQRLAERENSA